MNRQLLTIVRSGPAILAVGLGVLGVSAYIFLLVSGRQLGDAAYAPLGTLWILVFLVAPAFFFPIEQEVSRAVAACRAQGMGVRPVFVRATIMASGIAAILVLVSLALSPLYNTELFNNQWALVAAMLLAFVGFAVEYCLKGLLAGSGRLRAYGLLISIEGAVRAGAAIALVVGGVKSATPYAIAIGAACFIAVGRNPR